MRPSVPRDTKVCVVGAAGGIGQPLSMLLRGDESIKTLTLYDVAPVTPGVAVDLSHMNIKPEVIGYTGADGLSNALKGAEFVMIPAGVARKPGMTRDDLFNINAGIVANTAVAISKNCPNAFIALITNPINSTVPVMAEVLTRLGCYDPKRLFGITTLDFMRARTFVLDNINKTKKTMPPRLSVPVIGGHAGITILPLLSSLKKKYGVDFSEQEITALTQRIMFGGDEVVKAKAGGGSATLSMAAAAYSFFQNLQRTVKGHQTPRFCQGAFIQSAVCQSKDNDITFFSSAFTVDNGGVDKISEIPLGDMSKFELEKFDAMLPELKESILKGRTFGRDFKL